MTKNKNELSSEQCKQLIETLKSRFMENMQRHHSLEWEKVEGKLLSNMDKLWTLHQMEETGGEPDVIVHIEETDEYIFYDCSKESPKGRRSICYDREALESRKKFKPENSAVDMAITMGIEMLTEDEYRALQKLGDFDMKTSSWVHTPDNIRKLDGALFCDYRYEHVFVYHNGASSYYAARGFRGSLKV